MWTKKGKLVGLATLSSLAIALANDDVVMYGLFGAGVVLLGISYALARRALGGIECERHVLAEAVTEGDPLPVCIRVFARPGGSRGGLTVADTCRNLAAPHQAPDEHIVLIGALSADAPAEARVGYPCPRRGRYRLGPVVAVGSDLLGLYERRKQFDAAAGALVYPRTFDLPPGPARISPLLHLQDPRPVPTRGHGMELYGVREYHPGDDLRHVHWKATAHLGKLSIKEFEGTGGAALTVLLDLSADAHAGEGPHASLELAVRVAASIAKSSLASGGHVSLHTNAARPLDVPMERGEAQLHRILTALAEAQADGGAPIAAVAASELRRAPVGSSVVVVTPSPDGQLRAAVAPLLQRGAEVIVILLAAQTFAVATSDEPEGDPAGLPESHEQLAAALRKLGAGVVVLARGDDPREKLAGALSRRGRLARASPLLQRTDLVAPQPLGL